MEANRIVQGKIPVVQDDSYTLYLDEFEGLQFIHCDIYKWNKTTKKALHVSLKYILDLYKVPIYAAHEIKDNKHRKFLEMYGFKYFSTEHCLDNINRQVWINKEEGRNYNG